MAKIYILILIFLYILVIILGNHNIVYFNYPEIDLNNYKEIKVDDCDNSGMRQANVIVDIGSGDRKYYSLTNENQQVVYAFAKEIELQNGDEESSNGRLCADEAKVKGTELDNYDEGHIIADSLGGVSNAYNITPEDAYINRFGEQAIFESEVRDALNTGSTVTNLYARIIYPNNTTMIPIAYYFHVYIDDIAHQYFFINHSFQ